jgi:hypothetical protein
MKLAPLCCSTLMLTLCFSLQAQDDRFVVFEHGRHGYINETGEVVIPIRLQGTYALNFSEGLVSFAERVKPEPTKLPYVDKDGKLRLNPQEKWGFLDKAGDVVVGAQFDAVGDFSEGFAAVAYDTDQTNHACLDCYLDQKWGFIDKSGNTVIRPQYHAALSFSEGLAAVMNDKHKWGYINPKGEVVIPFDFDGARPFSEGLASVAINKMFGYINKNGRFIIPPRYATAGTFSEGLAAVQKGGPTEDIYMRLGKVQPGGTWAFIDADGKEKIILRKTVEARRFSEGLAAIYFEDGHCGYIRTSGPLVISPVFSFCEDFSEGVALVLTEGKLKYLGKEGRFDLETPYINGGSFKNGLASVQEGESGPEQKFGYINKQGEAVWKPRAAL